ncbi:muramidase [Mesorhizobium sp. LNJC384A00]|uniref:glycoside hydrolase family 25 protein n=1 Tax=Mesorhizobium sp. LNJC384A00 TaxID=1287268 RepID=UPI0003CDF5B9|nr:glycoside hydrolase family 25 protein [Mesorhizobium sp. LNJC384A00]ESY35256.1 muramidase [Mesorhizobium sp. LNJC384A00]
MAEQNTIVDISDYQTDVDFHEASKVIRGVIIKATQGLTKKQKHFGSRKKLAREAGMLVGSYHFGEMSDGRAQADFYLSVCEPAKDELLVLDFEEWSIKNKPQPPMTLSQARDFVTRIHEVTGRWPGLYGGSYLKEQLGSTKDSVLSNCWLWIAQYGPKPRWPTATWPQLTMWQYTGDGVGPKPHDVAGIGSNIDRDIFRGSANELEAFWASGGVERPVPMKEISMPQFEDERDAIGSPANFFAAALDKLSSVEGGLRRDTPLFFPNGIQYIQLDVTVPNSVKLTVSASPPGNSQVSPSGGAPKSGPPEDIAAGGPEDDPNAVAGRAASVDERNATNFGLDGQGDFPAGDRGLFIPDAKAPFSIAFDIDKAFAFLQDCMTSNPRVHYGYGKKIKPGQVPGKDFQSVDCSGLVRELVRRSTSLGSSFPDGSVVQHDWVRKKGFKKVDWEDGTSIDHIVRIAFLSPNDVSSGIGHVQLLYRDKTLESHGGVGPDSRTWSDLGYSKKMSVYRLTA